MVEVELISSAIAKMRLFAAMQVPEVWHHDGESLTMYRLKDSQYREIESSVGLPVLDSARINAILLRRHSVGETKLIKEFRQSISN